MANLILNKKGNTINLTDSTDNKVKAFTLYGKATQNGTPTPDAPVEIEVAGASGSVEVVSCGKNLLKNTATTQTKGGITYTINKDGSIHIKGQKTGITWIDILGSISGDYSVEKLNLKGQFRYSISSYGRLKFRKTDGTYISDLTAIRDVGCSGIGAVYFQVESNEAVDFVYYPQIEYGDSLTEYEPYTETTSTIPIPDGLCGIKVSSGGNYTNENGQQWICDEKDYGRGKYVQRIGQAVFDGSDDEGWSAITTVNNYRMGTTILSDAKRPSANNVLPNILCNQKIAVTTGNTFEEYSGISISASGTITVYDENYNTSDVTPWKEHLASNPMTVQYELAEPIETDISAEEIAELEKLHTFYPVTNISNDADCGMEISYVSTKQNMQVKALLSGVETTFTDLGNNVFEAVLTAPNHDGLYEIEINAVSQTGDTTSATVDLTVASWITSKIDWKPTDRLNIQDFNRIRNNMIALWELLQWEFGHFAIEDMGDELTEYTGRWNVNHFNAFEKNLEIFRTLLPIDDFGLTQTFYYNGMLIKYDELNRIENLLLRFKQYATSREAGIRKLPFRLGAFREVRI